MEKLKILFVINSLWGGGTERSLVELLPHLIKANITPVIVCFSSYPKEGFEGDVLKHGIDLRFLNGRRQISRVIALRQLIREESPDLIHTALFDANLTGRLANLGLPVTLLNSLTSVVYDPIRLQNPNIRPIKLRVCQIIDFWTARYLTTHFHSVSKAAKAAAIDRLKIPPERITVVERGRDPARLGLPGIERRLRARQQLGLKAEDEVIVNVGRHEFEKGQKYLLEAMTRLIRSRPRLFLLIAGRKGNFTPMLESVVHRNGLNGRVEFLGHRDDVPEVLAAADLFVFPSLYEGLPGAVIEAMALGLPIVASNIAAHREILEEGRNALLVERGSSREMVNAIQKLLENRDRATAFGKRSREIFEGPFTSERSSTRMIELYRRLAHLERKKSIFHISVKNTLT